MRSRRPLRRPHRLRHHPSSTPAQRMLQRAHRSMELGEHANAAALFEQLAREAHDRNRLRQAPRLYLQAARGYILAGDLRLADAQLWIGLRILAKQKNWLQLHIIGQRIIHELEEWGHQQLAQNVKIWLSDTLPNKILPVQHEQITHGLLPVKCPSCGGAILSDEVDWLDNNTGECPYCGSAVRAK